MKSQLDRFNPGPISAEAIKKAHEDNKKADKASMDRAKAAVKAR